MEILKKIDNLKKSIHETDLLLDKLIFSLEAQKSKVEGKENTILQLKNEIKKNVEKIDKIIKVYNANS